MVALQGSLLDLDDSPTLGPLGAGLRRLELARGAWVDIRPAWLSGADEVFTTLLREVPWNAERRVMYDSVVDVPRLTRFYSEDEALPHALLEEARDDLSRHYIGHLGEGFRTAGLCLYRSGADSVAWHGDRIGRAANLDTLVAILSLGSTRALLLRPRGGGCSIRLDLAHGDLVVMGGSCQRTWDHAIPKTSEPVGPRISVQFRPRGVR